MKLQSLNRERIIECLRAIVLVLRTYGYVGSDDQSSTADRWLTLVENTPGAVQKGSNAWMKVAKYKLAAFYSHHNSQRMPPRPFSEQAADNPAFLLGGGAGRYLTLLLKKKNNRESLLQSILQTKKGMPRPDKAQLSAAEEDFVKKITTTKIQDPLSHPLVTDWNEVESYPANMLGGGIGFSRRGAQDSLTLSKETVKFQLRRTVDELFSGTMTYDWTDRMKTFPIYQCELYQEQEWRGRGRCIAGSRVRIQRSVGAHSHLWWISWLSPQTAG
jgi:hypothetical protein